MREIDDRLIIEFGDYRLDVKFRRLMLRDSASVVALTPRAVDLLVTLACSGGRLVTKEELLDRVWAGGEAEEATLTQTMFVLRKTLGDDPRHPRFIRTVPGRGYQFVGQIVETSGSESSDIGRFHRFGSSPTINTSAQKAYIQGRSFWNKRTKEGLKESIVHFEDAIRHDPNFSYAYAGLANSHRLLAEYYEAAVPDKARSVGRDASGNGEMERHLAEAHTRLAYAQGFYEWDFAAADASFAQALQLDPTFATAHQWYGDLLNVLGRFDEARRHFETAIKLAPHSPMIATGLASYYYTRRDADRLIVQAKRILAIDPNFAYGHFYLGFGYEFAGREKEAVDSFADAATAFGEPVEIGTELKAAYEQNGMPGVWHKRLEQYETRPHLEHYPRYLKSLVPVRLGDKETSLAWLNIAFNSRDRGIIYAKHEPLLEPLHDDPRFQDLLKKIGLS